MTFNLNLTRMKKKLVLRKETVSILDGTMKNVIGGGAVTVAIGCIKSQTCETVACKTGELICTPADSVVSLCVLCRKTEACVTRGAYVCIVTYDSPSYIKCGVEI